MPLPTLGFQSAAIRLVRMGDGRSLMFTNTLSGCRVYREIDRADRPDLNREDFLAQRTPCSFRVFTWNVASATSLSTSGKPLIALLTEQQARISARRNRASHSGAASGKMNGPRQSGYPVPAGEQPLGNRRKPRRLPMAGRYWPLSILAGPF